MALRSNSTITLRSHHGKYIVAEDNDRMLVDRHSASIWESFTVEKHHHHEIFFGDKIHLRTHHGKYVCAEPNRTLIANRHQVGEWETFTIVDPHNLYGNGPVYPNSQVALRTHHGLYVCAEGDGRLVADRSQVGEWERFTLSVGGQHSQPSYNQGYVSQPYQQQPSYQPQQTSFQSYPSPQYSTPYMTQPNGGGNTVCFGDRIKLKHVSTGQVLHSHPLYYQTGSRQQQVSCYHIRDQNDYFEIQSVNGQQGPVNFGSLVTFRHCATGANLHSHANILSPVTGQQEVTCYPGRDSNDNWIINPVGYGGQALTGGSIVTITHANTHHRLHSHHEKYHCANNDYQQEVTCYNQPDQNDNWRVMEIQGRFHQE